MTHYCFNKHFRPTKKPQRKTEVLKPAPFGTFELNTRFKPEQSIIVSP